MILEKIENNINEENKVVEDEKKCYEKNMTIKKNSWDNCTYGVN